MHAEGKRKAARKPFHPLRPRAGEQTARARRGQLVFLVIALGLAQQQFWAPSRGSRAQVGASQQEQRSCEQHQGCVLRVTSSPCRQHCLIVSLCSYLRAAKTPGLAQSSTNAKAAATLDLHPAADMYCHISLQLVRLKLAVLCLPVLQPFLQLFLPSSFHTDHSTRHVLT